ncbi:MAG: ATP-binding protein [Thiohalomonadales bacterium]
MDGKKRNIAQKIDRLAHFFPVVVILGARQCGKSTLAKMIRPDWHYFDLQNPNHYQRLSDDPVLFFQEHSRHIIIDEAQLFPDLFSVLRGVVDGQRSLKNRFILTGSASFELMKNISESLAGRVGIVELAGFKINEFKDQPLPQFFQMFNQTITEKSIDPIKTVKSDVGIIELKHALLKGSYPEPVLADNIDFHQDWMQNYFDTYINRDMRSLFPRLDIIKYRRVLSMLSRLSGTIINKSDISRSIEASEKTVRDYLEIITGTYFWRQLEAYVTPRVKTTLKLPKGYFRDSGLIYYLQNINTLEALNNSAQLGRVFEHFIVEEVIKGIEATDARNLNYYHFRTKAGAEIDFIVEGSFGVLPIEVKMQSATPQRSLKALQNFIDIHRLPFGILINNSDEACMLSEKIIQIPAGCVV